MTIDDIITLTKAGFTKEEILSLTQGSPSNTTSASPENEPAAVATPAAAPVPEKAEEKKEETDFGAIIDKKLSEAFKPFEDLYNNIAIKANMPTIGQIQPKGIDDIVNDFFTK